MSPAAICPDNLAPHRRCGPPTSLGAAATPGTRANLSGPRPYCLFPAPLILCLTSNLHPFGGFGLNRTERGLGEARRLTPQAQYAQIGESHASSAVPLPSWHRPSWVTIHLSGVSRRGSGRKLPTAPPTRVQFANPALRAFRQEPQDFRQPRLAPGICRITWLSHSRRVAPLPCLVPAHAFAPNTPRVTRNAAKALCMSED